MNLVCSFSWFFLVNTIGVMPPLGSSKRSFGRLALVLARWRPGFVLIMPLALCLEIFAGRRAYLQLWLGREENIETCGLGWSQTLRDQDDVRLVYWRDFAKTSTEVSVYDGFTAVLFTVQFLLSVDFACTLNNHVFGKGISDIAVICGS